MWRITYFRNKCIGCNACVEAAPDRWRMSRKDGKCILLEGKEGKEAVHVLVHDDEAERNQVAAANCPVKIIRVEPA